MQYKKLRVLSSTMITVLAVVGFSSGSLAKSTLGKLRSGTGIIAHMEEGHIKLDFGKKGEVLLSLSSDTGFYQESISTLADVALDQILRLKGQGQKNTLQARQIVILPEGEKLSLPKEAKKGLAYGAQAKFSQIKAKVVQLDPLTVLNRSQQRVQVVMAKKGEVIKIAPIAREKLQTGMKVRALYREQKEGNQAVEILVPWLRDSKQAKK